MLATIDDNGLYHAGHVIKYWQLPDGPEQTPSVDSHVVLTPAQDSQVQYAMEDTTVNGTAVNAAVGLGGRQIIAKTGTTSNYLSGFFIGAIPQYTLVVGLFVNQQDSSVTSANNLADLGGGGFGGYWPANIWNTFAQAEFANLTPQTFPSPQFSGQLWNQIGPLPKAKPKKKTPAKCDPLKFHGRKFPGTGPGCVTASPTADSDRYSRPESRRACRPRRLRPIQPPGSRRACRPQRPRRPPRLPRPTPDSRSAQTPSRRRGAASRPAWPSAGCSSQCCPARCCGRPPPGGVASAGPSRVPRAPGRNGRVGTVAGVSAAVRFVVARG